MATPSESEIRGQLQRICESDTFRSAPQVSRLLVFLIDATLAGQPLKESVIGRLFFGRAAGYDSQADPVVRTEVRRLRLKLSEYYLKEGSDAPIAIEIPPGGYKVRFTARDSAPAEVAKENAIEPPVRVRRDWRASLLVKALAVAAVLLIAAVVWLPRVTGHSTGSARSIAVFRFRDLDGGADNAWMGSALSEMISSQLSGAGKLRAIAVDDDESNLMSVAPPDAISLRPADLIRIREELGADLVVAGSYAALGTADAKQYRIEAQVYDTRTGQSTASATESGDEKSLFEMVSRVVTRIGWQAGMTAAGSANDPSARNVSSLQQAKALVFKADSLPNSPLKESLYRQALEAGRKQGPGAWEIGPLTGLARIYAVRKDYERSADFYRQAYETSLKYNGVENAATAEAEVHWARGRTRIGQVKEAIGQVNHAIPIARRQLPPDSLRFWNVLHDAIHTCNDAKDYRQAEAYTNEGLAINARMHLPETSDKWGMLYWDLGRARQGEKNYREALAALDKAETNFRQFRDTRAAEVEADIDLVKAESLSRK